MPKFRCPKCGTTEDLIVYVQTKATLVQYKDGGFTFEPFTSNHDCQWDEDEDVECSKCNYKGFIDDFDPELSLYEANTSKDQ